MVHQYEEHEDDRFRTFVNRVICHGVEALTIQDTFIINLPGVWGVIGASLALSATINIGYGLIAVYLLLINAIVHIAGAIVLRRYNPGLVTSIVLFLPLGMMTLLAIQQAGGGKLPMQLIGAASSIAIHAAIIVHVQKKSRRLSWQSS